MLEAAWRTRWLVLLLCLSWALVYSPLAFTASKGSVQSAKIPTAEQLLSRHFKSEAETSYSGVQVVTEKTAMGSVSKVTKVYHKKPNKYRFELEQLGDAGNRITIDDLQHRWTYDEKGSIAIRDDSPSIGSDLIPWQKRRQLVLDNYDIAFDGTEKCVGRQVGIVALSPKWHIRPTESPAWRLWLDIESGLALKSEQYGLDGSVTMLMHFTEFSVGDPPESLFKPNLPKGTQIEKRTRPKPVADLGNLLSKLKIPIKLPKQLPMGFVYGWGDYMKQGDRQVLRLWYTDGLATLSVFQTYPSLGDRTTTISTGETTSIFQSSLDAADITVLADMAAESLSQLLDEVLGPWLSQEGTQSASARSVQERLRNVWRMLGLPIDSPAKRIQDMLKSLPIQQGGQK